MSILKSQLEIAEDMDRAIREYESLLLSLKLGIEERSMWSDYKLMDGPDTGMPAWQSTFGDADCFHCGQHIGNAERPFFWAGHNGKLVMHQRCLVDWIRRVLFDVERIVAADGNATAGAGLKTKVTK